MRSPILIGFVFGIASTLSTAAVAVDSSHDVATRTANASTSIPLCADGDGRTRIVTWTPAVDADNRTRDEPPQRDGQIVRIRAAIDADDAECNDATLQTISIPNANKSPGGLEVNIKGNAQLANGRCVLPGYYMNEDVAGMHQGWIETYFGAVDKQKIALSNTFCLTRDIDAR